MKINIICVGKLTPEWSDAFAMFARRINIKHELVITEIKEVNHLNPAVQQQKETTLIWEALARSRNIYLCSLRGKALDSNEFSALLNTSEITFVVGGSFGVDEERFINKITFSRLTFPHQMFRVILAEQIFRGLSLLSNSKYHK